MLRVTVIVLVVMAGLCCVTVSAQQRSQQMVWYSLAIAKMIRRGPRSK